MAETPTLKVGDSIPAGTVFSYVPYTPETGDITACGIPINYDASKGVSIFLPPHPNHPLQSCPHNTFNPQSPKHKEYH